MQGEGEGAGQGMEREEEAEAAGMPVVREVDMTEKEIKRMLMDLELWVIVLGDWIEDLRDEVRKLKKKGGKK